MKRATALRHLQELAREAGRLAGLPGIGFPLQELWVAGELLAGPGDVDHAVVILRMDVPADELAWRSLPPQASAAASLLRLPQRPVLWFVRSSDDPAWNPFHRSAVRFWGVENGEDGRVLEQLRAGESIGGTVGIGEYTEQMEIELARSRIHLARTLDEYWDPAWRRAHKGGGVYPEDHLWRAAQAVRDIEGALASS